MAEPAPGGGHQEERLKENLRRILESPSYRLAEEDREFLKIKELRPFRVGMEILKPELAQQQEGIHSTIVLFGGTRILEREKAEDRVREAEQRLAADPGDPGLQRALRVARNIHQKSHYYDEARRFSEMVSRAGQRRDTPLRDFVIVTGGGPGIMEAGNRGAYEVGAESIGLNITIPREQVPNPYITPHLCFQFHYFAMRKMHFLFRAKAMIAFPGGFGTLDELFETLTLIQTEVMDPIPVILFGRSYWERLLDFDMLVEEGVIDPGDLDLLQFADSADEAWRILLDFYTIDEEEAAG